MAKTPGTLLRGFAAMSPERRKAIARLGGQAVPPEKRTYSVQRDAASRAGKIGGAKSRPPAKKAA